MYEWIEGALKEKDPTKAVVCAGGVGYRLSIPLSTYSRLPPLEAPVLLYVSHVVREDSHTLYAFIAKEERDLFEVLIALSGIGPKTALSIIGHMELGAFHRAVADADVNTLSKIPGIGAKTAERLVVEMRDKVKNFKQGMVIASADPLIGDAMRALVNLGYRPLEAQRAVHDAHREGNCAEDLGRLIAAALGIVRK